MWAQIAGLALNKIGQNNAEEEAQRNNEINSKSDLLASQQQNILNRTQAENINIDSQRGRSTQQQVFDEIMKKYNVRL